MNFSRTLRKLHGQARREPGPETIDLEEDELFTILSDSRRRFVIERLADADRDPPTCAGLAVEIAADETHMDPELVPPRRVRPVEDDLRTEHLPRLADAGLLRWDGDAGEVRPGHSVEAVARLLGEIDRRVRRETVFPFSGWDVGGSADTQETPNSHHSGPPT